MRTLINRLTLLFLILFVAACSKPITNETPGEFIDSSSVTAKVKTNLLDQLGTDGFSIKVKTYKDEVQLSGFVDNVTIKKRAGYIALNTLDVKHVRNDIIVKR